MLLDSVMPEYDATRIEHRVIDGQPADVYEAAVHADFLDAVRRTPIVRGLFALRAAAERGAATIRRSQIPTPPERPNLRLAEMPEHGNWVRLGADPPNEGVGSASPGSADELHLIVSHEARIGRERRGRYAAYMVHEQAGGELPS